MIPLIVNSYNRPWLIVNNASSKLVSKVIWYSSGQLMALVLSKLILPPVTLLNCSSSVCTRAMTLGSNGSYFFSGRSDQEYFSPAFADNVVDATGAGDAFFCLTSCLLNAKSEPELIPFLGNVFAGLKTKIIGNKNAVSKASLVKAVGAILK